MSDIHDQGTRDDTCFGCKRTSDRVGVLLAQLGTPAAPTKQALRPYLKQFLSDRRVIEINPLVWWVILNGIILNTRPKRSAALYARIWTDEGSPLLVTTRSQAEHCAKQLKDEGYDVEVTFGMRYGSPSLERGIDELIKRGCRRILLFPMYPQYSASTTASTYDAVFPRLLKERYVPTLKVVEPYYNHRLFVEALVQRAKEFYESSPWRPEKLVLSYHGVPREYVDKGDPYCCQCVETTQHFIDSAGIPKDEILHCFQSKFGKDPWLNPYTDETIESLGEQGLKRIAVMCPGFTTDCLETIDEIGTEALEAFHEAGGEELKLIPCLNDHPQWIHAMSAIIKEEIASWLDPSTRRGARCAPCPVDRTRRD